MSISSSQEPVPLFPKLRSDITMRQKIKITVLRHNDNYFLGMGREKVLTFHEKVRPTREVTKLELDTWLNKNQRCLNKKLSWAIEMMEVEDDLSEFKSKLENNLFTSVAEGARLAAKLYSIHCLSYKANKSTVLTENGTRVVKKKTSELDAFKLALSKVLRSKVFDEVLNLMKMSTLAIKNEMQQENPSLMFAKRDMNNVKRDLIHNHDRLAILVICRLHRIINDI